MNAHKKLIAWLVGVIIFLGLEVIIWLLAMHLTKEDVWRSTWAVIALPVIVIMFSLFARSAPEASNPPKSEVRDDEIEPAVSESAVPSPSEEVRKPPLTVVQESKPERTPPGKAKCAECSGRHKRKSWNCLG